MCRNVPKCAEMCQGDEHANRENEPTAFRGVVSSRVPRGRSAGDGMEWRVTFALPVFNPAIGACRNALVFAAVVALLAPFCAAHDPLLDLPEPRSVPEAWNVINASVANVEKLFETNQLPIIAFQVANCSPAIRTLQAKLPAGEAGEARRGELQAMFSSGANVILATREKVQPREKGLDRYAAWRDQWKRIAAHYTESERNAAVYVCPMHPLDRHLDRDARCTACDMTLIRRRIPASPVYEKPGQPSMKLDLKPDRPLAPGRRATVTARLTRQSDGAPLREEDLLVMHTQRIHLLIVDPSLDDYHHEHPTPTPTPGEYVFDFTPRRAGTYRAWADVVPAESVVQEYVVTDMPAEAGVAKNADRETKFVDVVDGLRYELSFDNKGGQAGPGAALRVGETVNGRLTVTRPDGVPFTQLEPIMGAYAHLVGFADDYLTVVHLHPMGDEPKRPEDRGGPTLEFKFYPPVAGFVRFYSQVSVGGESRFARFGVTVAPGADKATR